MIPLAPSQAILSTPLSALAHFGPLPKTVYLTISERNFLTCCKVWLFFFFFSCHFSELYPLMCRSNKYQRQHVAGVFVWERENHGGTREDPWGAEIYYVTRETVASWKNTIFFSELLLTDLIWSLKCPGKRSSWAQGDMEPSKALWGNSTLRHALLGLLVRLFLVEKGDTCGVISLLWRIVKPLGASLLWLIARMSRLWSVSYNFPTVFFGFILSMLSVITYHYYWHAVKAIWQT